MTGFDDFLEDAVGGAADGLVDVVEGAGYYAAELEAVGEGGERPEDGAEAEGGFVVLIFF